MGGAYSQFKEVKVRRGGPRNFELAIEWLAGCTYLVVYS